LLSASGALPPDLPPSLVHQALQALLVFLKPGKVITALLGQRGYTRYYHCYASGSGTARAR
jgi:hypothetical protein